MTKLFKYGIIFMGQLLKQLGNRKIHQAGQSIFLADLFYFKYNNEYSVSRETLINKLRINKSYPQFVNKLWITFINVSCETLYLYK